MTTDPAVISAPKRDQLSTAKRALLERRLRGESAPMQTIVARPADAPATLSFAQERAWFLNQLQPDSSAYNMHEAFRVQGALDVPALERSVHEIVKRHDVLRTTFHAEQGQPAQRIASELHIAIPVMDLRHLSPAAQPAEIARLSVAEAQHHFDLTQGPLLRLSVARLGDAEQLLFYTIHHIISDEWSNGVFWSELEAFYAHFHGAHAQRPAINLAPLPIQYADFAHWQREWLKGDVTQKQLGYWREQLKGELPLLQLPTDRPRPVAQSYRGAMQTQMFAVELLHGVRALAQRSDATVFMTLLTAFYALLHRYTHQNDLLIGTPMANRNRPEVQNLIGFFLNTLVLRAEISGDLTFAELLARVRATVLDAFAHPDVPFEKLVEELQPRRDLSYNPIFQVMFVYQSAPNATVNLPGLQATPFFVDGGVAKFDLTFFAIEHHEGLEIGVEYATDLFESATITRLIEHFKLLLNGIVAQPQQPIARLPLLGDAERRQLLIEWNHTRSAYPREVSIHSLFEAHAQKTPDAPAVLFRDQQLTYVELNTRANQLAHQLRAHGVGANTCVGLCVERSFEMVIGILGILKAGGAYVPLDPSYPADRLAFMLEDSGATVVLTQAHLAERLPTFDGTLLKLDAEWARIGRFPTTPPPETIAADSLAYIIYTSGSTGKPKGVPISHRNLVHSTVARFSVYPEKAERYLLLSSFAFDSSVAGIFWALCQGGALCLPNQDDEKDVHAVARLITQWRVSHTLCLPSLYNLLLDYTQPGQLDSLRVVIVAGEACPIALIKRHYDRLPHATLYDEYGPTEGTVWSTVSRISAQETMMVPIGRPVPNMQAYILDAHKQPVPIGVAGELYIGGDGVAAGYWNRPDLSAERFIANPFSEKPDEKLYRTGDLVRYRADGNIDFLGRVDHQVKVRGHRVELGEIEAALVMHHAVREALVVSRAGADGSVRLVAYVSLRPEMLVEGDALRNFLRQRLPEFAVPATIITLDDFPRNANGKIERRALPEPEALAQGVKAEHIEPRHDLERRVWAIWQKLLPDQTFGVTDDFFALGGHSLLAARLFAEIEKQFNIRLPVASLYREATVAHVAKLIGHHKGLTDWYSLVSLQLSGNKTPFYCVHSAGGCVGDYNNWVKYLDKDQPFFGLGARGYGIEPPFERIEPMAAHYVSELTSIQPKGPYFIGGYELGGVIAFEMARQLRAQGETQVLLVIINQPAPGYAYRQIHDKAQFVRGFARNLPHWVDDRLFIAWQNTQRRLHPEPPALSPAQALGLAPVTEANSFINKRQRLLEASARALAAYRPDPYAGRIVLFRLKRQPLKCSFAPDMGWGALATKPIVIHELPGSMTTILSRPPYVRAVAEQLRVCFEQAKRGELF